MLRNIDILSNKMLSRIKKQNFSIKGAKGPET
jgi:hypothetical protein